MDESQTRKILSAAGHDQYGARLLKASIKRLRPILDRLPILGQSIVDVCQRGWIDTCVVALAVGCHKLDLIDQAQDYQTRCRNLLNIEIVTWRIQEIPAFIPCEIMLMLGLRKNKSRVRTCDGFISDSLFRGGHLILNCGIRDDLRSTIAHDFKLRWSRSNERRGLFLYERL